MRGGNERKDQAKIKKWFPRSHQTLKIPPKYCIIKNPPRREISTVDFTYQNAPQRTPTLDRAA
jgi:hypothetical protein